MGHASHTCRACDACACDIAMESESPQARMRSSLYIDCHDNSDTVRLVSFFFCHLRQAGRRSRATRHSRHSRTSCPQLDRADATTHAHADSGGVRRHVGGARSRRHQCHPTLEDATSSPDVAPDVSSTPEPRNARPAEPMRARTTAAPDAPPSAPPAKKQRQKQPHRRARSQSSSA